MSSRHATGLGYDKKSKESIKEDLRGDLYIIHVSQISFTRVITQSFQGHS